MLALTQESVQVFLGVVNTPKVVKEEGSPPQTQLPEDNRFLPMAVAQVSSLENGSFKAQVVDDFESMLSSHKDTLWDNRKQESFSVKAEADISTARIDPDSRSADKPLQDRTFQLFTEQKDIVFADIKQRDWVLLVPSQGQSGNANNFKVDSVVVIQNPEALSLEFKSQ